MALRHKRYGTAIGAGEGALLASIEGFAETTEKRPVAPPQPTARELYAKLTHGRVTAPEELPLRAPAGMDTRSARGYARFARAR